MINDFVKRGPRRSGYAGPIEWTDVLVILGIVSIVAAFAFGLVFIFG